MLATKFRADSVLYPLFAQAKLNGIRAICDRVNRTFQTRREEFWFDPMVEHIFKHLDALQLPLDPSVPLDGEFYVHGWSLQRIAAAMTVVRQVPIEDTFQVQYWIYDTISSKPFEERLNKFTGETSHVKVTPTTYVHRARDLNAIHANHITDGFEGTMVRSMSAPYITGRTNALQKIKKRNDYEVQVVGCVEGKGKFKGMLGAFIVEDPVKGVQFRVGGGSGFTNETRQQYWDNKPIGKWITVASEAGFSDGGKSLQCQFVAVRDYEANHE